MPVRFSSRFFVSEKISSCQSSDTLLIKPLAATHLDQTELERYSMRLGRFALEVKCMNELNGLGFKNVVFGNPLSKQLYVIVNAQDSVIPWQFLIDFVTVNFVYSNRSGLCLIVKVGFLDEIGNDVVDVAIFGDEKIVLLLIKCQRLQSNQDNLTYLFGDSIA